MVTWFLVAGASALLMAYAAGRVRRLPLSTSVVYLVLGYLLGPNGWGLLLIEARTHSQIIEAITEIVIVISIFSSALKLRLPLRDRSWMDSLRLAFLAMAVGVAGVAAWGHLVLGMSLGTALLLGGILAPTDPVLASDVQVERPFEFHRLRFALTGEAGMNDGTALPVVTLGLALLGIEPVGGTIWTWVLRDVVWGFFGAAAIGGLLGYAAGRFMLHLRLEHHENLGTDDFLALGLMGLSYGIATALHAAGFVAVFAAGVAVRGVERRMNEQPPEVIEVRVGDTADEQEVAKDPEKAGVFMLLRLESFTRNLERIGEAVVVILLGALLRNSMLTGAALLTVPVLFLVIRPVSVLVALTRSDMDWAEQGLVGWFGIRGMASVYYLAYIHGRGAAPALVHQIAEVVVGVVAYSILLHGISVTPVMRWFEHRARG